MAYQVLARKWRPKQFEDVVGQEHVTRTLQNAIKQNKLAHAYLFTGTRGVGKTSIARLFAKAIRCENRKENLNPCLVCASCKDIDSGSSMDYSEIDGASNNSVDDVRSLIENVQYLPTAGKHKIYVIDEVHMLSVAAFNALLKTLEEPPEHTIFVLATTDPHKLLGTVISRCQRYDFKNVPTDQLVEHLKMISIAEGIAFSNPLVIKKLAELGKGSVRDTLSIFDQVLGLTSNNQITEESFSLALGLAGSSVMRDLLSFLLKGEAKKSSLIFRQLIDENVDLKKLCDQVLDGFYRMINSLNDEKTLNSEDIIHPDALQEVTVAELFWIYETLVKDFHWALSTINPEKVILIILQKICLRRTILSGDDLKVSSLSQKDQDESESSQTKMHSVADIKLNRNWNDFLLHLTQKSPATATNLGHGNLLHEIDFNSRPLSIDIAFPEDAAVFKEYLEEKDVSERLKNHLADFYNLDVREIKFRTKIISHQDKADKNFKTKLEIEDEQKNLKYEEKRQKILNNPFVHEAQKLFNSKIDKIVLND